MINTVKHVWCHKSYVGSLRDAMRNTTKWLLHINSADNIPDNVLGHCKDQRDRQNAPSIWVISPTVERFSWSTDWLNAKNKIAFSQKFKTLMQPDPSAEKHASFPWWLRSRAWWFERRQTLILVSLLKFYWVWHESKSKVKDKKSMQNNLSPVTL